MMLIFSYSFDAKVKAKPATALLQGSIYFVRKSSVYFAELLIYQQKTFD